MKTWDRLVGICALALTLIGCGDSRPGVNNDFADGHVLPVCGNGVVEPPEVCDDGNQVDDLTCSSTCSAYCGDGHLDPQLGEACDGADLGGQTCETLNLGSGSVTCAGCTLDTSGCGAACGNGACEAGEPISCPDDCRITNIGAATQATCAVRADGSAWCWGGETPASWARGASGTGARCLFGSTTTGSTGALALSRWAPTTCAAWRTAGKM